MIITPTTDHNIIKSIVTNPPLFKLINGQDPSCTRENYEVDTKLDYLVAESHSTYFGLISMRTITSMVVETHIRIIPYYWKTGTSIEVALHGLKWLAANTAYRKTTTTVPGNCHHVLKFLKLIDFKPCGIINDGIIYNNELTSLIFFEKELVRI